MAKKDRLKVTLLDKTSEVEKTIATAFKTCYSPREVKDIYGSMNI